jgi:hypothetical protein
VVSGHRDFPKDPYELVVTFILNSCTLTTIGDAHQMLSQQTLKQSPSAEVEQTSAFCLLGRINITYNSALKVRTPSLYEHVDHVWPCWLHELVACQYVTMQGRCIHTVIALKGLVLPSCGASDASVIGDVSASANAQAAGSWPLAVAAAWAHQLYLLRCKDFLEPCSPWLHACMQVPSSMARMVLSGLVGLGAGFSLGKQFGFEEGYVAAGMQAPLQYQSTSSVPPPSYPAGSWVDGDWQQRLERARERIQHASAQVNGAQQHQVWERMATGQRAAAGSSSFSRSFSGMETDGMETTDVVEMSLPGFYLRVKDDDVYLSFPGMSMHVMEEDRVHISILGMTFTVNC